MVASYMWKLFGVETDFTHITDMAWVDGWSSGRDRCTEGPS